MHGVCVARVGKVFGYSGQAETINRIRNWIYERGWDHVLGFVGLSIWYTVWYTIGFTIPHSVNLKIGFCSLVRVPNWVGMLLGVFNHVLWACVCVCVEAWVLNYRNWLILMATWCFIDVLICIVLIPDCRWGLTFGYWTLVFGFPRVRALIDALSWDVCMCEGLVFWILNFGIEADSLNV